MIYVNVTDDHIKKYPPHKHDYWEIMTYLQGEGYMYTEEGNLKFSPGEIIIIPPGVMHGSVSDDGFKNISVGGNFGNVFIFEKAVSLQDNNLQEGTKLAQLLFQSQNLDGYYRKSLAQTFALFLLERLKFKEPIYCAIEKILMQIKENALDTDFKISTILQQSGYAEDYIRCKFKTITGIHPIAYVTKIRIERAKYLIDIYGNSKSLSTIAEMCGYLDYVYFSKKFKSVVGLSPKDYLYAKVDIK